MKKQESEKMITPKEADLLIAHRDGDMALLFLYLCRTGTDDRAKAGKDLFLPRQRLNEAYERLEMCGLLPSGGQDRDVPQEENTAPAHVHQPDLPEYTAEDVTVRSEKDSGFTAVLKEAQLIIGRNLSTPDLIKLLGIYDHLDLPADVMMELMHFVADEYRERYGEKRRPNVRAFEKEAQIWAERSITDFDAAETHIRLCRERKSMEAQIMEAMDIHDRDFTDTERRYVAQWQEYGFGPEEIHLAYDRTVTKTDKRSMAYMNGILQKWHERNLHSLKEILDKDRPAGHTSRSSASSSAMQPIDKKKLGDIELIMKGAGK